MDFSERTRLSRRLAGFSQHDLAVRIGVQRSAVGHWESPFGKKPTVTHLQAVAMAVNVQFEWLATGRGEMRLSIDQLRDAIPAATGILVDDEHELRLLRSIRQVSARARLTILEMTELMVRDLRRANPR